MLLNKILKKNVYNPLLFFCWFDCFMKKNLLLVLPKLVTTISPHPKIFYSESI